MSSLDFNFSFDLLNFVLGAATGAIVSLALALPRFGRVLARIVATASMGAGLGILLWAITSASTGVPLRPLGWTNLNISEITEGYGAGSGLLGLGIVALVLSSIGGRPRS